MNTTTEPSPLKYMGTQSRETVNMAAAMAHAVDSADRRADHALDSLSDAGSAVGNAADWAVGKAKNAMRSAAGELQARTRRAVADYTREDPIRAVLIAAGVGAVLMAMLARTTKSGARAVERRVRR